MSEQRSGGSSWALVALLWVVVLIPLAWSIYETMKIVVALFTG